MENIEDKIYEFFKLSPTAHNSQPFTFRLENDSLSILIDQHRLLPKADPDHIVLLMSLGALLETLEIGLSTYGLGLFDVVTFNDLKKAPLLASAKIRETKIKARAELSFLKDRFSYRGKFGPIRALPEKIELEHDLTLHFITDKKEKKAISKIYDEITLLVFSQNGYVRELYSWLRFFKTHKRWANDGVNREAMGLNLFLALGASFVLRPRVFSFLHKSGLARFIFSEAPQMLSASAICVFSSPQDDLVIQGRQFLRGWLKLTELGLVATSISLLSDSKKGQDYLHSKLELTKNEKIISVFRVGTMPKDVLPYERSRLGLDELKKNAQQ